MRLEQLIWECVNLERHRRYAEEWKSFFKRWRAEDAAAWPGEAQFVLQHERLLAAAERHGLVEDPLAKPGRELLVHAALERATKRALVPRVLLEELLPPMDELLP